MAKHRDEVSYYPEIQDYISEQIKSNFRAARHRDLEVFWGIGEMKKNLQRMINQYPETCNCISNFARRVPPLNLDIFAVITDRMSFRILILEVKLMKAAGLKEWSQLVGYCLVSGARYGLLINIDNGTSPRLSQILTSEKHMSRIQTIEGDGIIEHDLGFMQWNSITRDFEYSNMGCVKSLSALSSSIIDEFDS